MIKITGVCGIVCSECSSFLAGQHPDTAAGTVPPGCAGSPDPLVPPPKKINCCGCMSDDHRVSGICRNCEIRACAKARDFRTCACCGEYPCQKLLIFFEDFPGARENLERIREDTGGSEGLPQ